MNIHVGNLSLLTSFVRPARVFRELWQSDGHPHQHLHYRRQIQGFGLTEMPSEDHGRSAVAGLQGKVLDGNLLEVHEG